MLIRKVMTSMVVFTCLLGAARAQEGPTLPPQGPASESSAPQAATPATAALSTADVEAWLDGFVPYALQTADIAGAVVVVVKDGQVLAQRGFGYADVAARKPVDPNLTLFRPGSISKLFTWTSVMQLVEQGKLDLDTDVNTYLDFKIPERDDGPVTLRHIMTHTAGFEEQLKELMGVEGEINPSLSEHLRHWVPTRQPFEIVGVAPAGSLSASGADMAKFMIAHLQNGVLGSSRILQEKTAKQMHTTALTLLSRVQRMLLGFYEQNYSGRRIIGHGGDTNWFQSDLCLFIDEGVGLFISMNSAGKGGVTNDIRSTLLEKFADRYLPGPTLDGRVDDKTAAEHARLIAGTYENSRRVDSSFFSLLGLAGPIKVIANDDHTISVPMATNLAGVPLKWREIEPFARLRWRVRAE